MTTRAWIPFAAMIVFVAASHAFEADLNLNPRAEFIQASQVQAERAFLKADAGWGASAFALRMNGFAEADAANPAAANRRSRAAAYLQEAYAEYRLDPMSLRVGQQAVRWSESWALPSLDIWTAHRWNRLFYDPPAEQLAHPAGALFSMAGPVYEISAFGSAFPAVDVYPMPFPKIDRKWNPEGGVRGKYRWRGFDVSALYARRATHDNQYGGSLSYATDCCVPKIEAGDFGNSGGRFVTAGLDMFAGSWSALPQITKSNQGPVLYLPLRYTDGPHSFELLYLNSPRDHSSFFGALYGYEITPAMKASVFVQNYNGTSGLFAVYRSMTDGLTGGIRIESFVAF